MYADYISMDTAGPSTLGADLTAFTSVQISLVKIVQKSTSVQLVQDPWPCSKKSTNSKSPEYLI